AAGIAARVRLAKAGIAADAFATLNRGERDAALESLIQTLAELPRNGNASGDLEPEEARDLLRRVVIGILSEADPADPRSRTYRRKLAAALG
ncbi:MAG TPA: hypothetical protein VFP17_13445, partial [Solirubrobacterales bacterium]|nr:hypothetical protein [Solirubrobacterales bacterium]